MNEQLCRWGILGAAQIARKNWQAIKLSGNGRVVAVASREAARAEQFIDDCQGQAPFAERPAAVGGYQELLERDDLDAVYVPLPTGVRKEWVIKAAQAGKHVLCEKPCAPTAADLTEMIDACRQNHVQFMDGVMYMHSSRLDHLRRVIEDGQTVGRLRRIATQFSFFGGAEFEAQNIRAKNDLEPLGCLGDLGWYCLRFMLWVTHWTLPDRVTARILSPAEAGPADVPLEFSAEIQFPGGVSANMYCSFLTENQEWVNVSGEAGYVQVDDFVLPFHGPELAFHSGNHVFDQIGCNFHMREHSRRFAVAEYSDSEANAQEANLFRNFAALVLSGEPDYQWAEIALATQKVLDACLRSARNGSQPVGVD